MWPTGINNIRLDDYLVAGAWFEDLKTARSHIMQGNVLLDDAPQTKPGFQISVKKEAPAVRLRNQKAWVARSAEKLAGYLRRFPRDLTGFNAIDTGCGPGGFSQVLLEQGATSVVMTDVAFNVVDSRLKNEPGTVLLEKTHVKSLHPAQFYPGIEWPDDLWQNREGEILPVTKWQTGAPLLITGDISFLPLAEYIDALLAFGFIVPAVSYILLIKPQFELPDVGDGGIVNDEGRIKEACANFLACLQSKERNRHGKTAGLTVERFAWSTLTGRHGNREVLVEFTTNAGGSEFIVTEAAAGFLDGLL